MKVEVSKCSGCTFLEAKGLLYFQEAICWFQGVYSGRFFNFFWQPMMGFLGGKPPERDQKFRFKGIIYGCFQKLGYPKMDGLQWKIPLTWMIWGYHHFRKPPYGIIINYTRSENYLRSQHAIPARTA